MITIPGMRRGGIKEDDRGGEFKHDVYCNNFCKCHNVHPTQQFEINK
jgi:hypothetical protein